MRKYAKEILIAISAIDLLLPDVIRQLNGSPFHHSLRRLRSPQHPIDQREKSLSLVETHRTTLRGLDARFY